MTKKKETLRLEEYLAFLSSNKQLPLTYDLLNQIIFMHGFKKLHRVAKKELVEAVSAIELFDPARSTLKEEFISPCAALELEEIIADLKDLDWQECCVTSAETVRSSNNATVPNCASSVRTSRGTPNSVSSFHIRRKRKDKGEKVGGWGSKKKRGFNTSGADSGETGGDGESSDKCDFSSGSAALGLMSLGYSN